MSADERDIFYTDGQRNVWLHLMRESRAALGLSGDAGELRIERLQVISMLRRLCAERGDNEWPDTLHLVDVIEKHLMKYWEK